MICNESQRHGVKVMNKSLTAVTHMEHLTQLSISDL